MVSTGSKNFKNENFQVQGKLTMSSMDRNSIAEAGRQGEIQALVTRAMSLVSDAKPRGLKKILVEDMVDQGLSINELVDNRGYTLLHQACFKNEELVIDCVVDYAKDTLSDAQLKAYLNARTKDDGFIALHFAAFRGNVAVCEQLVGLGADLYSKNKFGINMVHVSAQGDAPSTIYYFKGKGLDLRSRDNRGSTPLHWACYSKSEVALVYLLSWVDIVTDQDCEGFTPLHLAVKSVETLKSTRPVRALLIKGAPRDISDNLDRKPIDLVEFITSEQLKEELRQCLKKPTDMECLMLKTPLKRVVPSYKLPIAIWTLVLTIYAIMILYLFPMYAYQPPVIPFIDIAIAFFCLFFHMLATCKDAGHIRSSKEVTFAQMLKQFDPVLLCPDCNIIRTDRSRHCSICNACSERYDHHCPWINNCVANGNHNSFLLFVCFMNLLLIFTFGTVAANLKVYDGFIRERTNNADAFFLFPQVFSDEWYSQLSVTLVNVFIMGVTAFFWFPVTLLTVIQLRNYCLAATTQERFSAQRRPGSRTSSYLSQGTTDRGSVSSIQEMMHTSDLSEKRCRNLHGCAEMCCTSYHPDQTQLYKFQEDKNMPRNDMGDNSENSFAQIRSEPSTPLLANKKVAQI